MSLIAARSNHGCWTCRARRKKCDEGGQPCLTCSSLQLICYGYGPRPEWMDGDVREKEQARIFKDIVKQNLMLKRHRRKSSCRIEVATTARPGTSNSRPSSSSNNSSYLAQSHAISSLDFMTPITPHAQLSFSSLLLSPYFRNASTGDEMFDQAIRNEFHSNHSGFDPMSPSFIPIDSNAEAIERMFPLWTPPMKNHSTQPELTDGVPLSKEKNSWYTVGCLDHQAGTAEIQRYFEEASPSEATTISPILLSMDPTKDNLADGSQILETHELDALRYYLDIMLPSHFPFLDLDTLQTVRGEMLLLVRKSKMCLSSILCQSIHQQQSQLSKLGLDSSSEFEEKAIFHEQLAAEQLQRSIGSLEDFKTTCEKTCDDTRIELQVCLAHLLFFKMLKGDNDWPAFLNKFTTLSHVDSQHYHEGESSPLRIFQNSLICLDILSCASTGSEPKFALEFEEFLTAKAGGPNLEEVIGCQNPILLCIMRIAVLQRWKDEQVSNGTLSVTELVKRALRLEHDLQQIRQETLQQITNHSTRNSSLKVSWIITNIFVCAASVYLHVTVSGPRPEVPEIQQWVTETIEALKLLPHARLLKRLTWPICIVACLASTNHMPFFEKLERGLAEECGSNQNILQALRVARECWKLRRYGTLSKKTYSWTDAMASIGDVLLLF